MSEGTLAAAVDQIDQKLQALIGGGGRRPGAGADAPSLAGMRTRARSVAARSPVRRRPGAGADAPSLAGLRTRYLALFNVFQEVDAAPSTQALAAVKEIEQQLPPLMARWQEIKKSDLPALNAQLKRSNLPEIKLEAGVAKAKATVTSKDKDEE